MSHEVSEAGWCSCTRVHRTVKDVAEQWLKSPALYYLPSEYSVWSTSPNASYTSLIELSSFAHVLKMLPPHLVWTSNLHWPTALICAVYRARARTKWMLKDIHTFHDISRTQWQLNSKSTMRVWKHTGHSAFSSREFNGRMMVGDALDVYFSVVQRALSRQDMQSFNFGVQGLGKLCWDWYSGRISKSVPCANLIFMHSISGENPLNAQRRIMRTQEDSA